MLRHLAKDRTGERGLRRRFQNHGATSQQSRDDLGEIHIERHVPRCNGRRDADGFLYIVGRKKEMIITSSGKNIAPAALEQLLLESEFISNVIVYGDQRPFLVALITIDATAVHAATVGGSAAPDIDDLIASTWVWTVIQQAVDRANARVSRPEQVKKFALLPEQWTPQGGQLTRTLKLRREVIVTRHRRLLDDLYGGPTNGRSA